MKEEEMKSLAEKDLSVWNGGNLSVLDEILSPKIVRHEVDMREDIIGIEENKKNIILNRVGFQDLKVAADKVIIKDDDIVVRWTLTGTNTGTFVDLPPTGKKIKVSGVTISHIVDGKAEEVWVYYNQLAGFTQLGFTIKPPE